MHRLLSSDEPPRDPSNHPLLQGEGRIAYDPDNETAALPDGAGGSPLILTLCDLDPAKDPWPGVRGAINDEAPLPRALLDLGYPVVLDLQKQRALLRRSPVAAFLLVQSDGTLRCCLMAPDGLQGFRAIPPKSNRRRTDQSPHLTTLDPARIEEALTIDRDALSSDDWDKSDLGLTSVVLFPRNLLTLLVRPPQILSLGQFCDRPRLVQMFHDEHPGLVGADAPAQQLRRLFAFDAVRADLVRRKLNSGRRWADLVGELLLPRTTDPQFEEVTAAPAAIPCALAPNLLQALTSYSTAPLERTRRHLDALLANRPLEDRLEELSESLCTPVALALRRAARNCRAGLGPGGDAVFRAWETALTWANVLLRARAALVGLELDPQPPGDVAQDADDGGEPGETHHLRTLGMLSDQVLAWARELAEDNSLGKDEKEEITKEMGSTSRCQLLRDGGDQPSLMCRRNTYAHRLGESIDRDTERELLEELCTWLEGWGELLHWRVMVRDREIPRWHGRVPVYEFTGDSPVPLRRFLDPERDAEDASERDAPGVDPSPDTLRDALVRGEPVLVHVTGNDRPSLADMRISLEPWVATQVVSGVPDLLLPNRLPRDTGDCSDQLESLVTGQLVDRDDQGNLQSCGPIFGAAEDARPAVDLPDLRKQELRCLIDAFKEKNPIACARSVLVAWEQLSSWAVAVSNAWRGSTDASNWTDVPWIQGLPGGDRDRLLARWREMKQMRNHFFHRLCCPVKGSTEVEHLRRVIGDLAPLLLRLDAVAIDEDLEARVPGTPAIRWEHERRKDRFPWLLRIQSASRREPEIWWPLPHLERALNDLDDLPYRRWDGEERGLRRLLAGEVDGFSNDELDEKLPQWVRTARETLDLPTHAGTVNIELAATRSRPDEQSSTASTRSYL